MSVADTNEAGTSDIIRLALGTRKMLFTMKELEDLTRKSRAWNYRAMKLGKIRYIVNGDQRFITLEEAERILRRGVGSLRDAA
jgi:hypothetical protein